MGAAYDKCTENGEIAPCIGDTGNVVYYCDDPRFDAKKPNAECMPSAQEWAYSLPDSNSVIWSQECAGPEGPVFTCHDPEFDIRKYPYGCLDLGDNSNSMGNLTDVPTLPDTAFNKVTCPNLSFSFLKMILKIILVVIIAGLRMVFGSRV